MRLVWVTGISGAGKSTVCEAVKSAGYSAIDIDADGFSHWVDTVTGEAAVDPPDPTPANWLDNHAWHIRPELVHALRNDNGPGVTFLFAAVANEREVWDHFDRAACIVVDDETLKHRLATRMTNPFGKHPEDLKRILRWNSELEAAYRRAGATIIDGTRPVDEVANAVVSFGDGP